MIKYIQLLFLYWTLFMNVSGYGIGDGIDIVTKDHGSGSDYE